jgi:hypothetical protein
VRGKGTKLGEGEGSKLGEPYSKVRLSQYRLPIEPFAPHEKLGEGEKALS